MTVEQQQLARLLRPLTASLARIEADLAALSKKVDQLIMNDAELKTLLDGIDATTNVIATNVGTIGTTSSQISSEIDAFLAAKPAGTVLTDAEIAQLQSLSARSKAAADASTAQVSVLQAIAAKGAPVTPPPPPVVTPPSA